MKWCSKCRKPGVHASYRYELKAADFTYIFLEIAKYSNVDFYFLQFLESKYQYFSKIYKKLTRGSVDEMETPFLKLRFTLNYAYSPFKEKSIQRHIMNITNTKSCMFPSHENILIPKNKVLLFLVGHTVHTNFTIFKAYIKRSCY